MKKAIATQAAPAAIGPYSQAIEANGTLFISGQIPLDPATGEFSADDIKGQTGVPEYRCDSERGGARV